MYLYNTRNILRYMFWTCIFQGLLMCIIEETNLITCNMFLSYLCDQTCKKCKNSPKKIKDELIRVDKSLS